MDSNNKYLPIERWKKSLKLLSISIQDLEEKRKKIKILTGIETCLVSWVAGGGALPAFIIQLTGKEGEKTYFALILFILYL